MTVITHSARLVGPLIYQKPDGKRGRIPAGPCLIEQMDSQRASIIWGAQGQSSTALPLQDLTAATETGTLVLLD